MRHAMTKYPGASWFWYLDQTALITNSANPIHTSLLTASKLEASMISNAPVVPPDSVIKTFSNLKGERIDFVVTQDKDGLAPSSFIVRNGEWAKYFLDVWFDPIYRSYNFQKAEYHALEHIVQYVSLLGFDKCGRTNSGQVARYDSCEIGYDPAKSHQCVYEWPSEPTQRRVQEWRFSRELPWVR